MDIVRVQEWTIDVEDARAAIHDAGAGGEALFVGTVRNSFEGRTSLGLFYESYQDLAEKEMRRIAQELRREFGILRLVMIHRVGELAVGEAAVLVAVSAAHRGQAFAACQAGIDRVKERVPIWKKERWAEGEASWHHDPASSSGTRL